MLVHNYIKKLIMSQNFDSLPFENWKTPQKTKEKQKKTRKLG